MGKVSLIYYKLTFVSSLLSTHCYFTSSNPKRKGPFYFCLPKIIYFCFFPASLAMALARSFRVCACPKWTWIGPAFLEFFNKLIYFCLFFKASVDTALASSFIVCVWQTWIAPHFWNSSVTSGPPLATRLLNKSSDAAWTPISTLPRPQNFPKILIRIPVRKVDDLACFYSNSLNMNCIKIKKPSKPI